MTFWLSVFLRGKALHLLRVSVLPPATSDISTRTCLTCQQKLACSNYTVQSIGFGFGLNTKTRFLIDLGSLLLLTINTPEMKKVTCSTASTLFPGFSLEPTRKPSNIRLGSTPTCISGFTGC